MVVITFQSIPGNQGPWRSQSQWTDYRERRRSRGGQFR